MCRNPPELDRARPHAGAAPPRFSLGGDPPWAIAARAEGVSEASGLIDQPSAAGPLVSYFKF